MKLLSDFIIEKLHPSKFKKQQYTFEPISNPEEFWGYNWILDSTYISTCKALLQYALDNCTLRKREETFINKFIVAIDEYFDKYGYNRIVGDHIKIVGILNGSQNNGYYQRPKCIYDICQYFLKHDSDPKTYEDEDGNLIYDDVNKIIKELDDVTKGKIKNLDWVHE